MQRYVPNVYRSHARSGEGFGQPPTHQKKCNQPYLEPVRVDKRQQMELLEQFALGELEAFEALFRQFQGEVYRWILRIVRDSGVAGVT